MKYQMTAHREAEVEKLGNIETPNVFIMIKASLEDPTVNYVRVCLSPELPTEESYEHEGQLNLSGLSSCPQESEEDEAPTEESE